MGDELIDLEDLDLLRDDFAEDDALHDQEWASAAAAIDDARCADVWN